MKKKCVGCIIDGTDACPRGAGRAVDDTACEEYLTDRDCDTCAHKKDGGCEVWECQYEKEEVRQRADYD